MLTAIPSRRIGVHLIAEVDMMTTKPTRHVVGWLTSLGPTRWPPSLRARMVQQVRVIVSTTMTC